jgi:hypothetical protein
MESNETKLLLFYHSHCNINVQLFNLILDISPP